LLALALQLCVDATRIPSYQSPLMLDWETSFAYENHSKGLPIGLYALKVANIFQEYLDETLYFY